MRNHCPQGGSFAEKPLCSLSIPLLVREMLREPFRLWRSFSSEGDSWCLLTLVWGVQIVARVSDAVVNRLQQSNHVFL